MNKDSLKTLMVRDKDFLKELYQSQSAVRAKQILQFSSDSKLKTLLLYLHFVANGEIWPDKVIEVNGVQLKKS